MKKANQQKAKSASLEQKKHALPIEPKSGNKKRFDQLLDDAVLGVKKK